jgi:hypothetical protein
MDSAMNAQTTDINDDRGNGAATTGDQRRRDIPSIPYIGSGLTGPGRIGHQQLLEFAQVGEKVAQNFVTLPAWFPADKASAVLRAKGKQFALISDKDGVARAAHIDDLEAAPSTKNLQWCAAPLGRAVAPTTSVDEMMRLVAAQPSSYIPVVMGGVVLGIISAHTHADACAADDERLAA